MLQENLLFSRGIVQIEQDFVLVFLVPLSVLHDVSDIKWINKAREVKPVLVDRSLRVGITISLDG